MYCTNKSQCESKRLRSEEVHCVLRKEAKCDWQVMYDYNLQDVIFTKELHKRIKDSISLRKIKQIKLLIKIALLVVSLVCIGLYIVVK